jgi:hypothetical protein
MSILEKTPILMTAHPKQQKWWRSVLLSLENYPGPLILSYDDIDTEQIPPDIFERFESCVTTGVPAGTLGHARGELICIKNGLDIIVRHWPDCHFLKLGFDEPVWRWRNIQKLYSELAHHRMNVIDNNTRLIFGPAKLLHKAFSLYDLIKLPAKPAESHYKSIITEIGIKNKTIKDYEWWRWFLGLTHLQGEYAANLGKPNRYSWEIGELWEREKS